MEFKTMEIINGHVDWRRKRYDGEELGRILREAQEWMLIDHDPFESRGYLTPVSDLILAVLAHQKSAGPFPPEKIFVTDGRLGGVFVTTGRCDTDGGMGGWKGFSPCPIFLEDFRRTLYDHHAFDYTDTDPYYEYHAYAILPAKLCDYACRAEDPEAYREACRQTYIRHLPDLYGHLDRDSLQLARDYAVFSIDPDAYKNSPSYDPWVERMHVGALPEYFHQKLYELLGETGWLFEPTESVASPRPEFIEEDLACIRSLQGAAD